MQGNYYFCSRCCKLGELIIKILNKCTDNLRLSPNCSKPVLNAVFVEKDIEKRCKQIQNLIILSEIIQNQRHQ